MARTTHTRLLLVVVVLLMALGITSCGNGDASGATPAGAPETIIEIELGDMYVKPDTIEIEAGQNVKLHVKNVGAMVHDLKINGTSGTAELVTGQEETITVGGLTESVLAWCTLPGHRESGMEMKINVKGMATHSDYDTVKAPAPAADESAKIDAKAMPSAQWQGRDPVLPAKATGTVHEISINAVESEIEVAPGVTQMMWSFDGMVPGPVYHGNVGDTFRFTLTNKGKMGHSIDFHASKVAWNEK